MGGLERFSFLVFLLLCLQVTCSPVVSTVSATTKPQSTATTKPKTLSTVTSTPTQTPSTEYPTPTRGPDPTDASAINAQPSAAVAQANQCPQYSGQANLKIPTVPQIIKYFMKATPARDTCYFYVGRFKQEAIKLASNHAITLYDIYKEDDDECSPFSEEHGVRPVFERQGQLRQWFRITSRAYATICTGVAYFVWDGKFPLVNDNNDISIWITDEFNAIVNGETGITKVIQVDPFSGAQKLFWPGPNSKRATITDAEGNSYNTSTEVYGRYARPRPRSLDSSAAHGPLSERLLAIAGLNSISEISKLRTLPSRSNTTEETALQKREPEDINEDTEGSYWDLGRANWRNVRPYIPGACRIEFYRTSPQYPETQYTWDITLWDHANTNYAHYPTTVHTNLRLGGWLPRNILIVGSQGPEHDALFRFGDNWQFSIYMKDPHYCLSGPDQVGNLYGSCLFPCGPWPYDADRPNRQP